MRHFQPISTANRQVSIANQHHDHYHPSNTNQLPSFPSHQPLSANIINRPYRPHHYQPPTIRGYQPQTIIINHKALTINHPSLTTNHPYIHHFSTCFRGSNQVFSQPAMAHSPTSPGRKCRVAGGFGRVSRGSPQDISGATRGQVRYDKVIGSPCWMLMAHAKQNVVTQQWIMTSKKLQSLAATWRSTSHPPTGEASPNHCSQPEVLANSREVTKGRQPAEPKIKHQQWKQDFWRR